MTIDPWSLAYVKPKKYKELLTVQTAADIYGFG